MIDWNIDGLMTKIDLLFQNPNNPKTWKEISDIVNKQYDLQTTAYACRLAYKRYENRKKSK